MTRTVRIGGENWHYHQEGSHESPALLLLHGFTGCAAFWDDVVTSLKSEFRCISVDLPGHGHTSFPFDAGQACMEHVAESLGRLLDKIGVDEFNPWGYSMGGRLALHVALRFPDRVGRLVLESASPGIADPIQRQQRADEDNLLASQIEEKGTTWFVEEWMRRPLFASQLELPLERRERARTLRLQNSAAGLAASLRHMGTGVQESQYDSLSGLKAPTMILVGEYDDKFRAIGLDMAGLIPHVLYCLIPRAGHAPFWEQPEHSVRAVRSFLVGPESPRREA